MVVVLVIWAKTGAAPIAREAAIKRVSAGFLRMVSIVARLGFTGADSRLKPAFCPWFEAICSEKTSGMFFRRAAPRKNAPRRGAAHYTQ
jgi:hypothetical protein